MFGDVAISVNSVDRTEELSVRHAVDPTRVVVAVVKSCAGGGTIVTEVEIDRRAFVLWASSLRDGLF